MSLAESGQQGTIVAMGTWDEPWVMAEGLRFPEGPVAMSDGSALVVEMLGGTLTRVPAGGGAPEIVAAGLGGPNGAAIGPDGAVYLCCNGLELGEVDGRPRTGHVAGSIRRVDLDTGEVRTLYTECQGVPLLAPNDLVFDDAGGFWFTDHGLDRRGARDHGGIHYATADGTSIQKLVNCNDPNGIGLSPDGSVLYWAETSTARIMRRRISAPGTLATTVGAGSNLLLRGQEPDYWTVAAGLPGTRMLDSLAIEADGRVCVGALLPGGVAVVSPDDGSVAILDPPPELADRAVTNICFGGDNLRTAFITCSTTGRLVACRWPRPGLQLAFGR